MTIYYLPKSLKRILEFASLSLPFLPFHKGLEGLSGRGKINHRLHQRSWVFGSGSTKDWDGDDDVDMMTGLY